MANEKENTEDRGKGFTGRAQPPSVTESDTKKFGEESPAHIPSAVYPEGIMTLPVAASRDPSAYVTQEIKPPRLSLTQKIQAIVLHRKEKQFYKKRADEAWLTRGDQVDFTRPEYKFRIFCAVMDAIADSKTVESLNLIPHPAALAQYRQDRANLGENEAKLPLAEQAMQDAFKPLSIMKSRVGEPIHLLLEKAIEQLLKLKQLQYKFHIATLRQKAGPDLDVGADTQSRKTAQKSLDKKLENAALNKNAGRKERTQVAWDNLAKGVKRHYSGYFETSAPEKKKARLMVDNIIKVAIQLEMREIEKIEVVQRGLEPVERSLFPLTEEKSTRR